MNERSAKVHIIASNGKSRDLLVLDASRAWYIELPSKEMNLDNNSVCVYGYNKQFKSLFGVTSHDELVETFTKEFNGPGSMDAFLKIIEGKRGFTVNNYRIKKNSSALERYIHRCAKRRYHISLEYFMYWYQGVTKLLLAEGVPEATIIEYQKKHPLQVGFIKAHGNGLTPEHVVKRLLEKPLEDQDVPLVPLVPERNGTKKIKTFLFTVKS